MYLRFIGFSPANKHQGYRTKLLKELIDIADRASRTLLLEHRTNAICPGTSRWALLYMIAWIDLPVSFFKERT
jgi:hypothetical protein